LARVTFLALEIYPLYLHIKAIIYKLEIQTQLLTLSMLKSAYREQTPTASFELRSVNNSNNFIRSSRG